MSHALVEEINVESGRPEIKSGFITVQGSLLDLGVPIDRQQASNVICATVNWNPLLESNSSTIVSIRRSATIDVLLDSKEDYSIHAYITGVILNIQLQSREHHNHLAGFDKCRAVGLLLRRLRPEHGFYTSTYPPQGFANSSPETLGTFERIGVFESEWLDMWTLQQLCTYGTRRERIKII
jgi:hypothetical protein